MSIASDYPGACTPCEEAEPIEAVILYPSLGSPMVLAPGQKKCSLILGTGAEAMSLFDVDAQNGGLAQWGYKYIDRHLRLSRIDQQKPIDTDTTVGLLYNDGEPCTNGEQHIKVWHLGRAEPGRLVRDRFGPYRDNQGRYRPQGRPFGVLGYQLKKVYPFLRELWEVQLDLDPLYQTIGSGAFMNWSWMVKTTPKHRQQNVDNFFIRFPHHEPQDRHIDKFLRAQCEDSTHHHYPHERLFERDPQAQVFKEHMAEIKQADVQRLQSWHPVIRAAKLPLTLAHLSDVHVNVRHHALARSPAQVLEDAADAGPWNRPVGQRVCHSYFALKALIDQAGASHKPDTALLFTGDLHDFNRNVDPAKVPNKDIAAQWSAFNILAKAQDRSLYKRGMDDILVYSLVRRAYVEHKLPVYMSTGNHESYAMPYGISPRADFASMSWAVRLGVAETAKSTPVADACARTTKPPAPGSKAKPTKALPRTTT